MSALNPWFLLAAASVAVPLFLHLFQRRRTRRVSFPALRYLERTEREHARRIKLRQILLLLVRVSILLFVVGAGARLVFFGDSGAHPPTALVLVVDNSMSSGRIVGDRRVLDELRDVAEQTLDMATSEDRIWVIRAGEPWLTAAPGGADEARRLIRETEPTDAAGDLTGALRRAVELLRTAETEVKEIHLLSDLQASAFEREGAAPAEDVPVVAWAPEGGPDPAANHALVELLIGRGLPPLQGQRAEITVRAAEGPPDAPVLDVRVVLDGRVRAAAAVPPGSEATIALPPAGTGWVAGFVETDPDALRADDRRYFAYHPRPAPAVALNGPPGFFVGEAVAVLQEAGRLLRTTPSEAELLISGEGEGLAARGPRTATLVLPPADPTLLPALNRRLAQAGIPWGYEVAQSSGGAELTGPDLPDALSSARIDAWFRLAQTGEPASTSRTVAEVAGEPWAVEGTDAAGRDYLVLASPLDQASTGLPTSTGLVRFVDWVTSEWAGDVGGGSERIAGERLPAPSSATHVRHPSGETVEIDGTRTVARTGSSGHYAFLSGDSVVTMVAVNTPELESRLDRLDARDAGSAIGAEARLVGRVDRWQGAIFRERQGPELWRPLLLLALLLLLAEPALAAAGRTMPTRSRPDPQGSTTDAVI